MPQGQRNKRAQDVTIVTQLEQHGDPWQWFVVQSKPEVPQFPYSLERWVWIVSGAANKICVGVVEPFTPVDRFSIIRACRLHTPVKISSSRLTPNDIALQTKLREQVGKLTGFGIFNQNSRDTAGIWHFTNLFSKARR